MENIKMRVIQILSNKSPRRYVPEDEIMAAIYGPYRPAIADQYYGDWFMIFVKAMGELSREGKVVAKNFGYNIFGWKLK